MHAVLAIMLCFTPAGADQASCQAVHVKPPVIITEKACMAAANAGFKLGLAKFHADPANEGVKVEMTAMLCGLEKDTNEK
jgi:hypothetical protein